jgi:hypothetical protein
MTNFVGPRPLVDIPGEVRRRIGQFAGRAITSADDGKTLTKNLGMRHPACVALSRSLDSFVKTHNPSGVVNVSDIEDDEATVGSTITLVGERVKR